MGRRIVTNAADPVTVMFTDVAGSTRLRSQRGDAVADAVLRRHESAVRSCLAEHQGREVQFLGDGFMASFPEPRLAVECAIHLQRTTDEHNRLQPDAALQVRIGIHHGPVTSRNDTLYGQTVHAAARILNEAAGGQILVSATVRDALADQDITFADRGLFWLKGFAERWRLYEARWRGDDLDAVADPTTGTLTPFVEREHERAQLRRAMNDARGGSGSLVVVTGDAGAGKSRLVRELSAEARAHGMTVLTGHCVQLEGNAPYLPFVEILEEALLAPGSPLSLRDALDDSAAEIARLVPSLRRVLPALPPPVDLPAEQAPRYLWNSILGWLDRAARNQSLVLVVEDLHWADRPALQLLEHLATHIGRLPVLLLGTYRDVDIDLDYPLARIVNNLSRRRLVTRVALKRLSPDGVAQMLRALSGREPPAALVDLIDRETEGNPFFVEEIFLHLRETGRLFDEDGEFRQGLRIEELDVPDSIRMLIRERLARLSPTTREVLLAAAISGRAFSGEVVAHVAALPTDALVAAFDESERARLVMPARAGRMMFTHELIRQTLLADISSVRREDLHARTAAALEQVHAADLAPYAEDIAFHLLRSGLQRDRHRLIHHLVVAGDHAMRATAHDEAVVHYEQALALGDTDRAQRAELLERLALARRGVGDWEAALATMDEALALYEDLERREDVGRLCWAMVYQLTWAARYEQAMGVATRGLAALGDLPSPDRPRLLAATAWVASLAGNYDTATGLFRRARLLAERMDQRVNADVLHMETLHHLSFAELREGVSVGRRAAEMYEAAGALWDLCGVLSFVMYQSGALSLRQGTDELAARVAELAHRLGHLGAAFLEAADRSRRAIMRGDLAELRALAATQIELCEQGGLPWLYLGYLYLGLAAMWRGDAVEAERQLRRATELEPASAFAGQSAAHLAVMLAHNGRAEEAVALYHQRRATLPTTPGPNSLGAWNTLLLFTEALYLSGRREDASAGYLLIVAALERTGDWMAFDARFASTRAGIAAAAGRRFADAERHYLTALQTAETIGHFVEQADIQRLLAWMYLDRAAPGDEEHAAHLLQRASGIYRRLGRHEPAPPPFLPQANAV